jgi:pimeloyl-ACP methyl ester carboxylesterase
MWPGHPPPPDAPGSWTGLAEDLLAGLRHHQLPPVIAVGHSFGAVASLLAAVRDRFRFRALAMLDPVIPPPASMQEYRDRQARGEVGFRPLVEGARKRRSRFSSGEEAFAYWRGKPLFGNWSDEALWRYTRAMLSPLPEGGFTLTWSPAWEAHYYESFYSGTWEEISKLDPSLPVLVVGGATSDTLLPEATALLRERIPWGTHRTIAGHGHLFPHSAPDETGRVLIEWLSGLEPPPR